MTCDSHSARRASRSAAARLAAACAALLILVAAVPPVAAQPDPRQMSGIPLPDPSLPAGTVSVRVIRGQMTNNVPGQPVELRIGDAVEVVATDADGRATFVALTPGATATAATDLDGVRLESQPFAVPAGGGTRLLLVGSSGGGADPSAAVEAGDVTFGPDSRLAVELGEESLTVFYYLDVLNAGGAPVDPGEPIRLTLPAGAQGATALGESAPSTRIEGAIVSLPGPFRPGVTPLRVAFALPYSGDRQALAQPLPVDLEGLLLVVEKRDEMNVASDQISRRADMGPDTIGGDTTYIFGAGPRVPAGTPVAFEISGLPHHSRTPSTLALILAGVMLFAGVWGAVGPTGDDAGGERRRRLEARKDKLFRDLVTLERQRVAGRIGAARYASRRGTLMASLEGVYRELDADLAPVVLSPSRRLGKRPAPAGSSGAAG
ncbi:MAG: hypothetical protein OXH69_13440 [Acidobacteria bacterium]|nr:hypothetical protein [Acidobacteriota bacterium]